MNDTIKYSVIHGGGVTQPDVLYNRFDLKYGDDTQVLCSSADMQWMIPLHIDHRTAYLGLYLVEIPQFVFDGLIRFVLKRYKRVDKIRCFYSLNNYEGQFLPFNHYRVILPKTEEELFRRMNKKGRYNLTRERRMLGELGEVLYLHYSGPDIPPEAIKRFFELKEKTHGYNPHMRKNTYVKDACISDVYLVMLDRMIIGIALTCEQCECVYLENITYDMDYSKYSVGFSCYEYCLSKLIEKHKKEIFLGGGDHEYKKRFHSIEETAYSGSVYRNRWIKLKYDNLVHFKDAVKTALSKMGLR